MINVSEALEEQHQALEFLVACHKDARLRPGVKPAERHQWMTDIYALKLALPFYWSRKTVELITSQWSIFDLDQVTVTRHMLYTDVAWHWFEAPPFHIELPIDNGPAVTMIPVRAISWYWFQSDGGKYLGATAWAQAGLLPDLSPAGPIVPVLWAAVDEGTVLSGQIEEWRLNFVGVGDPRTREEQLLMKRFVAAASTFLRQELLAAPRVRAERHVRKRLPPEILRDIAVVELRKRHQERNSSPGTGEAPDWQWSWLVRAHVRQQWYPSLGEHLPIIINPYLKGPEDKPLKPRVTPIFKVDR